MKKCSVDLVTGFLASGKTSFINMFLNKTVKREEVAVLLCEQGREGISDRLSSKTNINIKTFTSNNELTEERLLRLSKFYKPERMIIECNGVDETDSLLKLINSPKLRPYLKFSGLINIIDSSTFSMMRKNLGYLIIPDIERSDLVVLNKANKISKEINNENLAFIKELNAHAHILIVDDKSDFENKIKKARVISA